MGEYSSLDVLVKLLASIFSLLSAEMYLDKQTVIRNDIWMNIEI